MEHKLLGYKWNENKQASHCHVNLINIKQIYIFYNMEIILCTNRLWIFKWAMDYICCCV